MEPKITMPARVTREVKDRNKLQSKMKAIDYDEIDVIIDKKSRKSIFKGNRINIFPRAGDDGWYPTEEQINHFLATHKPLKKIDVIFLRSLLTVDKDSVFARNMMTDSQKRAYEIVSKMDLGQNRKSEEDEE